MLRMKSILRAAPVVAGFAMLCINPSAAQAPAAPPEMWLTAKTKGGVYTPPNRPLWAVPDMKKLHPGWDTWEQPIVKDELQEASYHSAAPGTKINPRMHVDTGHVFVVTAGEIRFTVEGQEPVTATRGSIINILTTTLYSYEVVGTQNAMWVEIAPAFYKTLYPAAGPAPSVARGEELTKVSFNHKPGAYTGENKLQYNTFDLIAKCERPRRLVLEDHLALTVLVEYVNKADNPCPQGLAGQSNMAPASTAGEPPFNPRVPFGHMHPEYREWWIVQAGAIRARIENVGEVVGHEGDVIEAAPSTWHALAGVAPSGPSIRLVVAGYDPLYNMYNTTGAK